MKQEIRECISEEDFRRAFPVMNQLRTHLSQEEFFSLLQPMRQGGYRLFVLEEEGELVACAGAEVRINLYYGRHVYIHELVTRNDRRSLGHGERLLAWVESWGREQGCLRAALSSGLQRKDAHRFYEERMGYGRKSYTFVKELEE